MASIYSTYTAKRSRRGFTLVEAAVGMAVFALLIASGASAITQTQKLAHSNVMHNTARTVVEGYMEQIKGIPYFRFIEAMNDPNNIPLETKGISSLLSAEIIQFDDPLYVGLENKKQVLLDIKEDSKGLLTPLNMDLYITPELTNISDTTGIRVIEITLNFRYESLFKGVTKEYESDIRFIKTAVSEY